MSDELARQIENYFWANPQRLDSQEAYFIRELQQKLAFKRSTTLRDVLENIEDAPAAARYTIVREMLDHEIKQLKRGSL